MVTQSDSLAREKFLISAVGQYPFYIQCQYPFYKHVNILSIYMSISFLNIIPFSTNAVNEYPFLTQAQRLLYEHIINNLHQQVSVDKVLTSHQDVKVIAYFFFKTIQKSTSHPLVR